MQNRVNPFGEIIETKARGAFMGNRGLLHNDAQHIVRPFKLKAWITCLLEFKGRQRQVMAPNRYTELFFLDEATAFAAGHRPCFECRRADYNRFKKFWIKGNAAYNFSDRTPVAEIDNILHNERMHKDGLKKTYKANIKTLPHGTFVLLNDDAYLIAGNNLYLWCANGYTTKQRITTNHEVNVLTPETIVHTFNAGYIAQTGVDM